MKKLLIFLSFSGILAACNNSAEGDASKDTTAATEKTAVDTAAVTTAPVLKDSVMQLKDGKMQIIVGGTWSALTAAVTTSNGRIISPDGEVSKNGKKRKLEEGMMIDKDGQITDKDGKAVDNTGWE